MPVWFIACVVKVMVLVWHHSQGPLVGMCKAPAGFFLSGGDRVVKLAPVSWQRLQPETMPVWFIVSALVKLPGLVLPAEWQFSQGSEVGTCAAVSFTSGGVLGRKFAAAPWQLTQPLVMPVWFIEKVAKPPGTVVFEWQDEQSALVGMWPEGWVTIVTPGKLLPAPWQVEQFAVFTAA
jgi:hypothetical protein